MTRPPVALVIGLLVGVALHAEDWPEVRGRGRMGDWKETGLLERFPSGGPPVLWRTPLGPGSSGPAVANGRVYVTDLVPEREGLLRGKERLLCLDEATGRLLWTREWPADYHKAGVTFHAEGPAATPTVDGDRVYVLGRAGALVAVNARNGEVLWSKDFKPEYNAQFDSWGTASAPIVEGSRLIALVGGEKGATVVAWDKVSGKESWRALALDNSYVGTAAPVIVSAGGVRQLIIWHPVQLSSLNPSTGAVYWSEPFAVYQGTNPSLPVYRPPYLMISNFTIGSMMLKLDDKKPAATVIWKGKGTSEIDTDGLHALMSTFLLEDGYIYGFCSYGQLRCLRLDTGERVWETQKAFQEKARYAGAYLVRNGQRVFIFTDRGDLVIAKLTPGGYEEIDRAQIIEPTSEPGNRRQLKYVTWAHPAFANRHVYVRNDREIIARSLAADGR